MKQDTVKQIMRQATGSLNEDSRNESFPLQILNSQQAKGIVQPIRPITIQPSSVRHTRLL